MQRKRVAILISGRGSNMASLIAAAREPDYPAEIVSVISNRPEAEGLRRAREAGIPALAVDHKAFPDRLAFEQALDQALREHEAELICLAGFMRVFTPWFIEQWPGRMLNIHPSLLPLFKGIHTHREALAAGVRIHGCTVHFVVPELDSGPIIAQAAVPVLSGDTEDALAARVLVQEHVIYPEALRLVCEGKAALLDRQAVFCGNDGTPSPAAALVSCGG
jgi:phosphoribosylglycinamide formyltransferase 1